MRRTCFFSPFVFLLYCTLPSYASSVALPIGEIGSPAADLTFRGEPIDSDQAVDLSRQNQDLSLLNPVASDVWTPNPLPATPPANSPESIAYPDDSATVSFDSYMKGTQGIFRARVAILTAEGTKNYQLLASLNAHSALSTSALLRKLGFTVPAPKYYHSLTIRFTDVASRDKFLDKLSDQTLTSRARWIKGLDPTSREVTLQGVVLEPAQIDIQMYHWGVILSSNLKGRRTVRSLILPLVLMDIPESINLYSWKTGSIISNSVILSHTNASEFFETSYDDIRWIARRILALSHDELREIVDAGQFPPDIGALVLEKLVSRRNQLIQLFNLQAPVFKFNTKITVGSVKKGKLQQQNYEGYPQRFTYGDPASPLRNDEMGRYLLIAATSNAIRALTDKANEALTVASTDDAINQHTDDIRNKLIDHIQNHPTEPFVLKLGTWGAPVGAMSVNADRAVVSGTYYGSDAKVQLVDTISVQGSVGYFMGLDGVKLPVIQPGALSNLTVQRNYIHVRPIIDTNDPPTPMKAALKAKWKQLWLPGFMKDIGKRFDPDIPATEDPDQAEEKKAESFKKALDDLADGEMLIVTDTVALGAQGQVTVPIIPLMSLNFMGFFPTIDGRAGAQAALIRRTVFTKSNDKVQVYLQNIKAGALEFGFDINWWINFLDFSKTFKQTNAHTKAFLLSTTPKTPEEQHKMARSLRTLLEANNSEILEENFPFYRLEHAVSSRIKQLNLLGWNQLQLSENHTVKIQPKADSLNRYKPKDEEREFYSTRIVSLKGRNSTSLVSALVKGFVPKLNLSLTNAGSNPANTFLGKASWWVVSTEAEVTPKKTSTADTAPLTRIDWHWSGWSLSKKDLFKILDKIETPLRPLNGGYGLVKREEFNSTKNIQLYEVAAALLLHKEGMKSLEEKLLPQKLVPTFWQLVELEGKENMKRWCTNEGWDLSVHRVNSYLDRKTYYFYAEEDHKLYEFRCIKNWMAKALKLKQQYAKNSTPAGHVEWTNKLVRALVLNTPLSQFLTWVGKENYFFQIKVSGFRTKDENGDMAYTSDTLGKFWDQDNAGTLSEISENKGIPLYELSAQYLSEGY